LEAQVPDLMVEAIRGGSNEAKRVAKLVEKRDALAMGPGMGTNAVAIDLVMRVLSSSKAPVVLDADGISNLAARPEIGEPAAGRLVLTPHPGEMARLMGLEIGEVLADRLAVSRQAAKKWKAVVVLKGPRTLIVRPNGCWAICNRPDAALAKAGSGDVLCGIIGALLAQRLDLFDAACLGVLAHNAAGRHVADEKGAISAMASDFIDALPHAWRELGHSAEGRRSNNVGSRPPSR
jgi:NAD(P)H-hydrate epimerase